MRYIAFLLFATLLFVPSATAQSSDTGIAKPQPKPHRVWDNDSIQELQGGINVVGESSAPAQTPAGPRRPVAHKQPGVFFKVVTIDGNVITSDALQGRPVLVQYWATWCPHCQADQEPVERIARAGIPVLAVDVGESEKTVRDYLKKRPRSCAIALEKDSSLASLPQPKGYPMYVLIDADGHIAGTARGEQGDQGLRNLLGRAAPRAN